MNPEDDPAVEHADALVEDWAGAADSSSSGSGDYGDTRWGEPIPLGPDAPDPYPVAALPTWVRDHVTSVAEATQTPTDLPLLLSLSALSVATANKARTTVRRGYREPAHVWTATVLPPGSRKSPVFRHMSRPIFECEEDQAAATETERLRAEDEREVVKKALDNAKRAAANAAGDEGYGEARQRMHELREKLDGLDVPSRPRLVASDVTSEKLARMMAENGGRIAILAPEGDLFRIMAGRYSGGVNFDHYKRAWTGDEPIRDDRMGREGTHVRRPALTMGLTLQPSVLETLEAKESFRGEGLLARFLYAVPDHGIGSRLTGSDVPALDQKAARRYGDHLRRLIGTEPRDVDDDGEYTPHELELSADARAVLFDLQDDVETMLAAGGPLEHLRDWGAKLPGHVTRVAAVLHAARRVGERVSPWGAPIAGATMEAAAAIGRAAIPHALQVFDALEADPETRLARYLLRRIRQLTTNGDGPLTKRDLYQATKQKDGLGTVEDLETVLRTLEAHRYVRLVDQPSEGRGRPPGPEVHLNPRTTSSIPTIPKKGDSEGETVENPVSGDYGDDERGADADADLPF